MLGRVQGKSQHADSAVQPPPPTRTSERPHEKVLLRLDVAEEPRCILTRPPAAADLFTAFVSLGFNHPTRKAPASDSQTLKAPPISRCSLLLSKPEPQFERSKTVFSQRPSPFTFSDKVCVSTLSHHVHPIPPLPKPESLLGYHRSLAPNASVKVSPICLGTMSFGDAWKDALGFCDKKTTFEILDHFHGRGGNFTDTASNYQNE